MTSVETRIAVGNNSNHVHLSSDDTVYNDIVSLVIVKSVSIKQLTLQSEGLTAILKMLFFRESFSFSKDTDILLLTV